MAKDTARQWGKRVTKPAPDTVGFERKHRLRERELLRTELLSLGTLKAHRFIEREKTNKRRKRVRWHSDAARNDD